MVGLETLPSVPVVDNVSVRSVPIAEGERRLRAAAAAASRALVVGLDADGSFRVSSRPSEILFCPLLFDAGSEFVVFAVGICVGVCTAACCGSFTTASCGP